MNANAANLPTQGYVWERGQGTQGREHRAGSIPPPGSTGYEGYRGPMTVDDLVHVAADHANQGTTSDWVREIIPHPRTHSANPRWWTDMRVMAGHRPAPWRAAVKSCP